MDAIVPVILCGGSGTRLWPRSRIGAPKPFLPLVGERSLFEAALDRCARSALFAPPVIVTGALHLGHVEQQLGDIAGARIIIEPMPRNTAAAIAAAACTLPPDAVMLICPSDHHIGDDRAFRQAAEAAASLARQGWLVSFGIKPDRPETGFGYLRRGTPIADLGYQTERFIEKPDIDRAQAFLTEGAYDWNGGIFAMRVRDFLSELWSFRPDIASPISEAVRNGTNVGCHLYPDAIAFEQAPSVSVDYAVMELTTRAALVPVEMNWSDIGNWQALHQARSSDGNGNSVRCAVGVELVDCERVLVDSDKMRVSVIGMKDVIIVIDGNDVLVTSAAGVQKVGKLDGAANQSSVTQSL